MVKVHITWFTSIRISSSSLSLSHLKLCCFFFIIVYICFSSLLLEQQKLKHVVKRWGLIIIELVKLDFQILQLQVKLSLMEFMASLQLPPISCTLSFFNLVVVVVVVIEDVFLSDSHVFILVIMKDLVILGSWKRHSCKELLTEKACIYLFIYFYWIFFYKHMQREEVWNGLHKAPPTHPYCLLFFFPITVITWTKRTWMMWFPILSELFPCRF